MSLTRFQKINIVFTGIALAIFGDVFDVAVFLGLVWALLTFVRHAQKSNPAAWPNFSITIVLITLQICYLGSLNRVFGYPDKELLQYSIPMAYFFLQILILIFWGLKKINGRAVALAMALVWLPIAELPTLAVRTLAMMPFLSKMPPDVSIVYVSHVGLNRSFAVTRLKLEGAYFEKIGKTETLVVAFFDRSGFKYEFTGDNWLLNPCTGSMDCQTPNVPYLLWWLIKIL